jgi:hypothetical protein
MSEAKAFQGAEGRMDSWNGFTGSQCRRGRRDGAERFLSARWRVERSGLQVLKRLVLQRMHEVNRRLEATQKKNPKGAKS